MGEKRVIDINDETARALAQIITNDKALAILHAIEEEPKSITQLSRELGFPLSTVSYHIDRMLRVGLVEVAGVKYGKRLQEVRLYRASSRPILLVPRREAAKVTKKLPAIEKLHVISLSVATFISALVYEASRRILLPGPFVRNIGGVSNTSNVLYSATNGSNSSLLVITTATNSTASKMVVGNSTAINTSVVSTAGVPNTIGSTTIPATGSPANYTGSPASQAGAGQGWVPLLLAVVVFATVFLVSYYLLKRRIPKRF